MLEMQSSIPKEALDTPHSQHPYIMNEFNGIGYSPLYTIFHYFLSSKILRVSASSFSQI
jgi:hypothetical protein